MRSGAPAAASWTSAPPGSRLDVPDEERAGAAAGVLAVVDGMLLVRFLATAEVADRAVGWLVARLAPPAGGR